MVKIEEFEENGKLEDMVPIKVPKWMTYQVEEDDEELYEGQFSLFEDKNPWASRDDYRFLNSESSDSFPDDSNIKQPSYMDKPYVSALWVIDITEHWLSDNELPNPYHAFRPDNEYDNKGNVTRTNPNIRDTYELNKVQRKYSDRITTYMGDPSYIEDIPDRFLYLDITAITREDERVSIKIFAPRYNKFFNKQMSQFKWAYHKGQRKLYIPAKYNGKQWNINGFQKNTALFIENWIRRNFNVQVNTYNAPYINGYTLRSYRDYHITDEEVIEQVNNIARNHKVHAISTPNQQAIGRV